jgi:hypothetical protein
MSASLYWEPVERKKYSLEQIAPSSFMESLEQVFGRKCPTLGESDIRTLRAMAVASGDSNFKKGYERLADGIEKYGEIEVTAVY